MHVHPDDWPDGAQLLPLVLARVPPALVAPQGESHSAATGRVRQEHLERLRREERQARSIMLRTGAKGVAVLSALLAVLAGVVVVLVEVAGAVAGIAAPFLLGAFLAWARAMSKREDAQQEGLPPDGDPTLQQPRPGDRDSRLR